MSRANPRADAVAPKTQANQADRSQVGEEQEDTGGVRTGDYRVQMSSSPPPPPDFSDLLLSAALFS